MAEVIYRGMRVGGAWRVLVIGDGPVRHLRDGPGRSGRVRSYYSPGWSTAFMAELAHDILQLETDGHQSQSMEAAFAADILARLPANGWDLSRGEIDEWIRSTDGGGTGQVSHDQAEQARSAERLATPQPPHVGWDWSDWSYCGVWSSDESATWWVYSAHHRAAKVRRLMTRVPAGERWLKVSLDGLESRGGVLVGVERRWATNGEEKA